MTTAPVPGAASRSPRTKGITVTVRLFPEVHGAVLEALARVPRGSRSARVIHLLTVGLMCERAVGIGRIGPLIVSSPAATDPSETDAEAVRPEDVSFVSALMESVAR